MKILSIGQKIQYHKLNIHSIEYDGLSTIDDISTYDYIIINGGDGSIRRTIKQILHLENLPKIIINATGSFNVIAKIHNIPTLKKVFQMLHEKKTLKTQAQPIYKLNNEIFLFSAGNMGDLQHIFLSETLRFGILQKGISKYILSAFFLLPIHIIMTPFMLLSSKRFFIFTPISFIKKFGSFYGKVAKIKINLQNKYNLVELDGDIVTIEESILNIEPLWAVDIVTR